MPHIFISYTREDGRAIADRLCAALQGRDPWFDQAALVGGADWVHEIEHAIDTSDVFLAVMTRAYNGARFAPLELARAFERRKLIIPLRFDSHADMGLFLAKTQYIDFSNPAAYDASLHALLERLDTVPREPVDERAAAGTTEWDAVRARTERQTRRVVTTAFYDPRVYVHREAAENELAQFLAGPASAFVITGDSGVGKSSLLGQWALQLLAEGHAVLTYDCSTLPDTDIEENIARDLSVYATAFEELDREAAAAGRNLVLIFDSISDYRGSERNGAQVLIRRLHTLVTRLPGRNIRVVLSCTTATWDRLSRIAPIRFDREQFHYAGNDPYLQLPVFSESELAAAYPRYRDVYGLFSPFEELPQPVRERLREPVLLRMTAEAYRDVKQPLSAANLGLAIYKRYFDDRVKTQSEEALVNELAELMLATKNSALSMIELARHETLGPKILDEDPASAYSKLLDDGVLQEVRGDVRAGIIVKFSHSRVAAYALAKSVVRRTPNVAGAVADFIKQTSEFPLAWAVARTLLLLCGDEAAYLALAAAGDPEQRTLVNEALVELHAQDPKAASALLQKLLDQRSEESRRTALRAAYSIGPDARDFFLRAAVEGDESIRESLRNTLYLIWRNESPAGRQTVAETFYLIWKYARGFTYEFLESLLPHITLWKVFRRKAPLELFLDLIITIYINHCDEQEVIDRTADLLYKLSLESLHLNLFRTDLLGPAEKVVIRSISGVFGEQVFDWLMFAEQAPVQEFFRVPAERRARLSRIADFYDPATQLSDAHDDLLAMLGEDLPVFSGAAAMAIGIHAHCNFAAAKAVIEQLWEEVDATGRRWLLYSMLVLLGNTPPEWVEFLQTLTRRYIDAHREQFLDPPTMIARQLDLVLVPLGLAYGKRRQGMPLFDQLLGDALAANDIPIAARCIASLQGVGFYDPYPVFDVLRPAFARLDQPEITEALITALATMRTLHFDAVDQFLNEMEATDALRHRVDAAVDVARVRRFIRVLGFYNNGVHLSSYYPKMRAVFSAGALRILAAAKNPPQFIVDYTQSALRLLRGSNFQVKEWIQ